MNAKIIPAVRKHPLDSKSITNMSPRESFKVVFGKNKTLQGYMLPEKCQFCACFESRTKKGPQSQKITRTAPQNFLNNLGGGALPNKNKGFVANHTRKFTQKFGKVFFAQVLWGTFSVPDLRAFSGGLLKITLQLKNNPRG